LLAGSALVASSVMSTVAWVVFAQLLTGGLGLVASMTAGRYSGLSDIDQSKVHYECLVTTPVSIGFVMPQIVRYLTHPQVLMEPLKDVRAWSLNEVGNNRVATLAARLGSLSGTRRVVSSDETKALETATPLSRALGVSLEVRSRMRENDRSATGFLPPPEFEAVADQFFAEPATSVRGWETAEDAQHRIVTEVEACLARPQEGDILFVGHGGVGTLLLCALSGIGIDRRFDQGPGGGGCWFAFDAQLRRPQCGWQPMEALMTDD
jgi:broad specificity phosphatase PhoE